MSEKNVYGIVRIEKIKCSDSIGLTKRIQHNTREFVADNVDPTRLQNDEFYGLTNREEIIAECQKRWNQADTIRKDSVGVLEVLTAITGELPQGDEKDLIEKNQKMLESMYGAENVLGTYIHRDETNLHIHAFVVPLETARKEKTRLTDKEKKLLSAELYKVGMDYRDPPKKPGKDCTDQNAWNTWKREKKAYEDYKKKIKPILERLNISQNKTVLNAQKFTADKQTLSQLQDLWHENVFKDFGLARGERVAERQQNVAYTPTSLHKLSLDLEEQKNTLSDADRSLSERSNALDQRETLLKSKMAYIDDTFKFVKEQSQEVWNELELHNKNPYHTPFDMHQFFKNVEKMLVGAFGCIKQYADKIKNLEEKVEKLTHQNKIWREETTPEQFREIADTLEKNHCRSWKQYKDKEKNRGFSYSD